MSSDNAAKIIGAFEDYYSTNAGRLTYNRTQRAALENELQGLPYRYLRALFDEIVSVHETKWRTLPDVALIVKAEQHLGRPEIYQDPSDAPQITDDAGFTEEELEEAVNNFVNFTETLHETTRARKFQVVKPSKQQEQSSA